MRTAAEEIPQEERVWIESFHYVWCCKGWNIGMYLLIYVSRWVTSSILISVNSVWLRNDLADWFGTAGNGRTIGVQETKKCSALSNVSQQVDHQLRMFLSLSWSLSPAPQCQRGKGIQVSTLQPFIVKAEGAFVCYTLIDYYLRIAIPCQERAHPIC